MLYILLKDRAENSRSLVAQFLDIMPLLSSFGLTIERYDQIFGFPLAKEQFGDER